jgi:hypothetical protein
MKRIMLMAFAVALLTLSVPALADISVDLIADGGDTRFDAGDVDVTSDGTTLTVRITVNQAVDPWELVESHVHVAETAAEVPQKNGNPKPGKFDYCELDPEATTVTPLVHEYTIPYALAEGATVVVAVHAAIEWLEVLGVPDDDPDRPELDPDDILHEETGWGDGADFPGKNWAMYIEAQLVCAWDVTGDWILAVNTGTYVHEMTIQVQQIDGTISGIGRYPAGGPYTITWTMTGNVSGSSISMLLVYDSSTYTALLTGTIAEDGSMSGGAGTGGVDNWETTSGEATRVCTLQLSP